MTAQELAKKVSETLKIIDVIISQNDDKIIAVETTALRELFDEDIRAAQKFARMTIKPHGGGLKITFFRQHKTKVK